MIEFYLKDGKEHARVEVDRTHVIDRPLVSPLGVDGKVMKDKDGNDLPDEFVRRFPDEYAAFKAPPPKAPVAVVEKVKGMFKKK